MNYCLECIRNHRKNCTCMYSVFTINGRNPGGASKDYPLASLDMPLKKETKDEAKLGKRHNKGKVRWRNFPLWLCRPLADIGTYGEIKYEESWNFLKGLSVTDCIDSLYRHLEDFDNPEKPDEDLESKLNNLGHIAWNALVAAHFMRTRPDLDDRYKTLIKKNKNETK